MSCQVYCSRSLILLRDKEKTIGELSMQATCFEKCFAAPRGKHEISGPVHQTLVEPD